MNLVARRCTFSIKSLCLMVYGDQTLLAYSSFGHTSAQYRVLLVLTFFTSLQIRLIKPRARIYRVYLKDHTSKMSTKLKICENFMQALAGWGLLLSGVTRVLIGGRGGGVYIHIFVFCPNNFY